MNIGVVLAGGIGSRFGSKTPKQYQTLCGKEVISYAISALKNCEIIDKVIVVASKDLFEKLKNQYDVIVVEGGSTRNQSLYSALSYIADNFDCDKIIILEAARPMITPYIVKFYLEKLNEYDAVITGQHITDSLGSFKQHVVNRSDYYLLQAPEAFDFKLLYKHFDLNSDITATNQQLPSDTKLFVNFNFEDNYKITYHNDLQYCEDLMKGRQNNEI